MINIGENTSTTVPEVNVTINTKSRKSINIIDTIIYILMEPNLLQKNDSHIFWYSLEWTR